MKHQLLPCPFCGRVMPPDEGDNLIDILYPSGTYWRMKGPWKHYVSHPERQEGDQQCWGVHCAGCSAEVSGDSEKEAVAAWNRRAA